MMFRSRGDGSVKPVEGEDFGLRRYLVVQGTIGSSLAVDSPFGGKRAAGQRATFGIGQAEFSSV